MFLVPKCVSPHRVPLSLCENCGQQAQTLSLRRTLSQLLTSLEPLHHCHPMPMLQLHRLMPTISRLYSCSAAAALSTAISARVSDAAATSNAALGRQCSAIMSINPAVVTSTASAMTQSPSATTLATAAQPRVPATFRMRWSSGIHSQRRSRIFSAPSSSFSNRGNHAVPAAAGYSNNAVSTTFAAAHLLTATASATTHFHQQ